MADSKPTTILVVDDEVELMKALCDALTGHDFAATGVSDPHEALALLQPGRFHLLLSDLMMPSMNGIQLMKAALEVDPELVAIIMTGHGTVPTAIEALKAGAYDYLLKPFKFQTILPTLQRGLELQRLRRENLRLRRYVESLSFESSRYTMIGSSPAMKHVTTLIEKVAPTDATVLVRGPSGAGKELVARALHYNSTRRDKPLVTVNCAALQETLLESELFGHEKGAFTGATQAKPGLFAIAEGGTLFIDEIAEMSATMQAKLLRVLENGHYRRVGGTQEQYADVRIITATNKPLEEEQKAGRFREDLFYRLNVFSITLPPLKDRKDDIPALVAHLLTTRLLGKEPYSVTPEAMQALMDYNWPGNIRELANVLERAQILADHQQIQPKDLPDSLTTRTSDLPPVTSPRSDSISRPPSSPLSLRDTERHQVQQALETAAGNKVRAARLLGVSRRALY
ncbi:MAG: sigma-54 dependent transcriptional regulator, partial [Bacteroidales bacterium]|nr:sigma-54 dependent transcriptional regulator [Bacteroidales bacterium]